ncbi:MAG: DUF1444 family protein [Planctomycetota bacterium]
MAHLSREQFAQDVVRRVRARFPLVQIGRAEQPFSLRVNGHVASLENLYRIAELQPDELQHQIERWAVELLRVGEGRPDHGDSFEAVADNIMPILLNGASEGKRVETLASQPLVADLHVGYVIDGDRTIAYIPQGMLQKWEVTHERMHEQAIANLVGRSQNMSAHAMPDEDGELSLMLFQLMDGYDASRLLLPALHDRLREHLDSPFCAAVPNRDILLCFRDDEQTVEKVRGQIKADYRTMPYHVSDAVLLVTADGVAAYR